MATENLNTSLRQSIRLDLPGEHYFLTTFEESDATALYECLSIDAVSDNLISVPKPYSLDMANSWIANMLASKSCLLPINNIDKRQHAFLSGENHIPLQVIRYHGRFVGCCSLTARPAQGDVELGYYIHPSHQGKGLMYAAGLKLLEYARDKFGVGRVYATADCTNLASTRTLEKLVLATAVGEVKRSENVLSWPLEKKVEGRELNSKGLAWEWSLGA